MHGPGPDLARLENTRSWRTVAAVRDRAIANRSAWDVFRQNACLGGRGLDLTL